MRITLKKAPSGETTDLELTSDSTVGDVAAKLAVAEGCDLSQVVVIYNGAVISKGPAARRKTLEDTIGAVDHVLLVYMISKKAAPAKPVPAPVVPVPAPPEGAAAEGAAAEGTSALRVLLLIRHGQCCHEGEADELKALTAHGHKQAGDTAQRLSHLFDGAKLPSQRALLQSTSRRARETAEHILQALPGISAWNGDVLRETDPTKNPLRAEGVFQNFFAAPPPGQDCIVVVAHNNIILYLLMRAAGVPVDQAAQAWRGFHLRHASITRVEIDGDGKIQIAEVGTAGHISPSNVTWNNIRGEDSSHLRGGAPERQKFSGRMVVLVRGVVDSCAEASQRIEAAASYVKDLTGYMVSRRVTVACTSTSQQTASAISQLVKCHPVLLPDSTVEYPEGTFLQFFQPPEAANSRDTVVIVAEDGPLVYWLLRALNMTSEEATAASRFYNIGQSSVALVNVKNNGTIKVIAVGDTGHLPTECYEGKML